MQKRSLTFLLMIAFLLLYRVRLASAEPFQTWFKDLINEDPNFTTEELHTIQQGKIVARARDDLQCPGKGAIILLRSYGTVNLKPEECWKRMLNLSAMYQAQPLMAKVTQIPAPGPAVYLHHTLGLLGTKYFYVNRYDFLPQEYIITYIIDKSRPYNVADGFGFWRIYPWGDTMSLVENGTYMDLGFKINGVVYKPPSWLMKQLSLIDSPNTIKQLRKYLCP